MATAKTTKAIDVNQYQNLVDSLNTQLRKSKTALTPNTAPTSSDLQTQLKLLTTKTALDKAKNDALKADIYGAQPQDTSGLSVTAPAGEGLISRTLHALGAPLYGIVGATEAALGKGTKPGLANIAANIKEQGTFGDLLRSYNVNKWAALPVGLALDIALDPVNWLTAGTTAVIPKLATGLKDAGIAGALEAGKAAGLQKASTLSKIIPFISKATREGLATKASTAEDAFRELVGKPSVIEEISAKSLKPSLGEKLMTFAKEKNIPGVQTFEKYFKYSPSEHLKSLIKTADEEAGQVARRERGTIDDALQQLELNSDPFTAQLMTQSRIRETNYFKDAALKDAVNPPLRSSMMKATSEGVQAQMKEVVNSSDDLERIIAEEARGNMDNTGVKWYDDLRKKANNSPIAKKIADTYEKLLFAFKLTKVSLNPTSYTNAIIGNHVMAGMMGLNVTDPTYLKTLFQTFKLIGGKPIDTELASEIARNVPLKDFVNKYGKVARELGLSQEMLDRAVFGTSLNEFGKEAGTLSRKVASNTKFGKAAAEVSPEADSFIQRISRFFTSSGFRNMGAPAEDTSILRDVFHGPAGQMMEDWRNLPNTSALNNVKRWTANISANASESYQRIDQTFKIGNLLHLTVDGVSEGELKRISRFVKLAPSDITKVGNVYKFSPLKAAEVANEAFMNYAAMPAAVRVLRSMPLLGSPFISFTYGTAAKAGKTLINNPALYNKITFARNEVARTSPPTPLEKTALQGPYYNYLNTYERVKLPFFQSFPTYLNIANWVPYLGVNMFNPSERKYSTSTGEAIGGTLDKLPFLKTPEGQVLFDYIIQPYILNEAQPTGMFGQPLYHQSDTGPKKALRAAEALPQAFVPSWVPPAYPFQQVVNAMEGKNAQGIDSSKSGYDLLVKAIMSTAGIPISDLDLSQQASTIKKQLTPPKAKK